MSTNTNMTGIPPVNANGLPNRSSTPDNNNQLGLPPTASLPSDPSTSMPPPSGQPLPIPSHPGQNMPDTSPIGLPPCTANGGQCPNPPNTSTSGPSASTLATTTPQTDVHDDGFSSDDNTHDNSNTSSVQGKSRIQRPPS